MTIIVLSSLPYIHDVISIRGGELHGWVPDFGIQNFLTNTSGRVLGFSTYRVFIYTTLIHVFAHLGWLGWFFEAKDKLYRPFLLVPVCLSLYQISLILLDLRSGALNTPNVKIVLTIVISSLLAINFFLNNKKMLKAHFFKHKSSPSNQPPIQTEKEHIN